MILKGKQLTVDFLRAKCKEHNLKVTPQRAAIFEELQMSNDHPSADVIYRRVKKIFPYISFDTVYRTLITFDKIGIITVVEGYGEPKRFDSNFETHHHFRCLKCNTIMDFWDESYDNIDIPEKLNKQCTVLNKKVILEGICEECRKKIL
ncbi:MAG: Fur family transcriptional regulator [Candidatus Aminicenantaceae bacterium]